ncbi:MAG TPA: cytochrome c [Rhodopila sp.]|uniref:c-type cytochrome n=1 Tax=Rhodopila sp. TaxID=2480087 RepID=UPI002C4DD8C4|nr:cytochrome c [Rhodopila sp.]HVY15278.1 cytochrome c [Rhodopila sp.]
MFRGFVLGIAVVLIAGAVCGYLVISNGMVPAASLDGKPLPLEHWAARTSLRATLAAEAPKGPNPMPLNEENLMAGITLYGQNCAICHGSAQGESAASPVARGEFPRPPQMATDGVEDDPEGWTYWKIENGIRWTGMPAWKGVLTDKQMWTLALFLKHMDKLPAAPEQAWKQVKN